MERYDGVYIDGSWRTPATGDHWEVINPATEEPFGVVSLASAADVDAAVRSAERTHAEGTWAGTPLDERRIVQRVAELIRDRAPELARLRSGSMGAPYRSSLSLSNSVGLLDMYVDAVQQVQFTQLRSDRFGHSYVVRRPVGVVAGIVPWNVPVRNELKKIIPAVLAGCTVVLKPALESPLAAAMLMDVLTDAGVPPGVVNMVVGGAETGEALVRHPSVDKVAFTGSTATGARIASIAGPMFKRLQLELGGKSAAIVCEDAELEKTIPSLLTFGFGNSGQICAALTRILVPRRRQDEIVDALVEGARQHVVGDPMDPATTMGPLVSRAQRDKVLGLIAGARREGATLATGGGIPSHLPRGWYVEPTVFADVTGSMTIAQEEVFGPVLSVMPYDDEAEAVRIANDSRYGLHGAVHSRDPRHALELAMRIETGTAAVNSFDVPLSAPFGGVKHSGVGRENGIEGYDSYLEYHAYKVPEELVTSLRAPLRDEASLVP